MSSEIYVHNEIKPEVDRIIKKINYLNKRIAVSPISSKNLVALKNDLHMQLGKYVEQGLIAFL
jgi:hypothetical protein